MKCPQCGKEMQIIRMKQGDVADKKMGQTFIDVEGAVCESCGIAIWGDGERRSLT